MGLQPFSSMRPYRRSHNESHTTLDNNNNSNQVPVLKADAGHSRLNPKRVVAGIRKIFSAHRWSDNRSTSNAPTPFCSRVLAHKSTESSTIESSHSETSFQSRKDQSRRSAPSLASTPGPSAAHHVLPSKHKAETLPMVPWPEPLTPTPPPGNKYVGSIVLDNGAQPSEIVNQTELDSAMADMRAAEKILHQRHAAIKPQQNIGKKMKFLKPVIKQDGAKDVSPQYGRGPPVPTKDTCSVSQRRQLIKNLAFDAVHGCPTAMAIMNQVNCHSTFKADGLHDLVLMINGKSIHMALCGIVEHNWITRFNAFTDNIALVDRRAMALEDHEEIVTQLFPETRNDILRPEHFRVFVLGLGEEGILTMSQAKAIARLGVSIDEFDRGANFDGSSKQVCYNRHHAMLQIPDQSSRDISSCSLQPIRSQSCNIHDYLLTLVEATVYDQENWQGYNCANARSQFDRVYDAYELDMQDWLLPAHLTEYKRSWNYREQRLLQRARIICELLDQYKSGKLSDFGIIRAIRGTYIQIPAQPYFSAEDLESFLYHRVTDSGLSVSRIPDILILHPDNDAAFAKPRLRNYVMNSLKDRAYEFKREEEQRLNDIKISCLSFKMAQNSQMTPWQRLKTRFRRMFGKEEVAPFDPFAPQHDVKSERR